MMETTIPQRVQVANASEIPVGARKLVTAGGVQVALFNVEGVIYAVNNHCPHRGGPLIRGHADGLGIKCPMHGWRYDLRTGASDRPATATVYPVITDGDAIFIDIGA